MCVFDGQVYVVQYEIMDVRELVGDPDGMGGSSRRLGTQDLVRRETPVDDIENRGLSGEHVVQIPKCCCLAIGLLVETGNEEYHRERFVCS